MNTQVQQSLLTIDDVRFRLNVCRSHIYKLMKSDSLFPQPIRLGTSIRFLDEDLKKYINDKVKEAAK